MPGKNKPKRLDRNTAWRVARRKKKTRLLVNGNSRKRKPRPKHKSTAVKFTGRVAVKRAPPKEKKKFNSKKSLEKKE